MKNSNFFLCSLIFLAGLNISFSQSTINDDKAHRRYWYYRTRFVNDFIKMGKNQGECIALAERNEGLNQGIFGDSAKVGPDQIDLTNMYLATLALEYKLLTRNNQNTDGTIREIYQLLYTLNRLDLEAEYLWSNAAPATPGLVLQPSGYLNGYMLREDIPADFISTNLNHFNYELLLNGNSSNGGFTGLPHLNLVDHDTKLQKYVATPTVSRLKETSLVHDKYYSMLAAFMFIVKYIPQGKYYYENGVPQQFQDGTYGIQEQAIAITNRLYPYIRGFRWSNIQNPASMMDWILKQPDGSNIGFFAGAGMADFSFSASRAICYINNGWPWAWTNSCLNYNDPTTLSIGYPSYNLLSLSQPTSEDLAVFTAWNHAICNYPTGPIPCWDGMYTNTNLWHLEWAELVREILFETHPIKSNLSNIEIPIDNAPCNGPFNFSGGNNPGYDWSSQDRSEHPTSMGNITTGFPGYYPGVDYMFLHNLFYEYLNQQGVSGQYQGAINLMDNYDTKDWPQTAYPPFTPAFFVGVNSNSNNNTPARIKVFQNLKSRAQIWATNSPAAPNNTIPSSVEYRAGKEIALLPEEGQQPGFSVEHGSEFSAYVQRYLCSIGDYGSGMRPSGNTSVDDFETDEMNTTLPLHYVEHIPSSSDLYSGGNSESSYNSKDEYENSTSNMIGDMEIFPNPNGGIFKIIISRRMEGEVLHLTILDMKGLIIVDDTKFESGEINLTDYPKGIYLIKVRSSLGIVRSRKVSVAE
jgi:hypothetical protein